MCAVDLFEWSVCVAGRSGRAGSEGGGAGQTLHHGRAADILCFSHCGGWTHCFAAGSDSHTSTRQDAATKTKYLHSFSRHQQRTDGDDCVSVTTADLHFQP